MKLETFFEKFELFADAPDAVGKMRVLVLELAVTGKLVAQDNNEEPAASLLATAASERAKLVAARKIKARQSSPVELEEQPYEVPPTWAWARLSDVGHELGQKVPDKRFSYIDVGGIDSDKGRISERVEHLEPNEAPSRARKLVTRGTVIYSTVRPYLRNIAIVEHDFDPEPIASTAFGILHPFAGIDNRYLFYWLRSGPFTAYVEQGMKGMAYPAINDEKFYSGYIPLPPLAEQKRIVAKVDELLELCDRLEAQQKERETQHAALARASLARFADAPTPANLGLLFHKSYSIYPADLRKSILTLAVQGKLVPQDPNDEPAVELVHRIAKLKEQFSSGKRAKAAKRIRHLDETKCSHEVPETWTWCRLGDLVLDFRYGTSRKCDRNSNGVPVLRIPNIQSGRIDATDLKFTKMPSSEFEELRLQEGDLILVRSNGSENLVGRTAVASSDDEQFAYAGYLVRARTPSKEVFSPFLQVALSTPPIRDQIEGPIRTTSGVKNINTTELSNLVLPIPPLAEQRRIVAKVDELMALVDALEAQLATAQNAGATLMKAAVSELTAAA